MILYWLLRSQNENFRMKKTINCCFGAKIIIVALLAASGMCNSLKIILPAGYTALAGDLEVHMQDLPSQNTIYHAQLLEYYPEDDSVTIVTSTPITFDYNSSAESRSVIWKARFRCGIITQGGRYGFRVQLNSNSENPSGVTSEPVPEFMESSSMLSGQREVLVRQPKKSEQNSYTVQLDVRWPSASLSLEPSEIETYPSQSVIASIMFPSPYCEPAVGSIVPEMWATLVYCGHSVIECKPDNKSHLFQVLYSEQIRGYPLLRTISLQCQLFGQAGYYGLLLTTGIHGSGTLIAITSDSNVLKAVWSEKFVFNVHARSIFRCDAHAGGVAVLFQYPECILNNDRVRLFGRLRMDVASLVPPTSLQYITEQKISKGKHNLYFDCELFSEKYVEYCFVYVSQAITGAVNDVRMDCIPTFPVGEKDAGHWGSWSEWSPCTTSCKGGTRNRYRFCDSPPPKYGAKFCEGHALETEECGNDTSLECQLYSGLSPELLVTRQDIKEEIGPGCKCGCVVHLTSTNSKRLLAASTKICPRKALWLIQAEPNYVVQLHLDQIRFPCASQKLKIHDGEFLYSNLLAQFVTTETVMTNLSVISSSKFMLLELLSGELMDEDRCTGGFLCHVQQLPGHFNGSLGEENGFRGISLEAVHVAIIMILLIVLTMSLFMIIQYVERYHKYQRASIIEEITDTDFSDTHSKKGIIAVNSHETLTSSLLIEDGIPMRKLDKKGRRVKLDEDLYGNEEDDMNGSRTNLLPKNKRNSGVQTSNFSLYEENECVINEDEECTIAEVSNSIDQDDRKLFSNSTVEETLSDDLVTSPTTAKDVSSISRRASDDVQSSIASSTTSPTASSRTAISSNTSLKDSILKKVKDLQNQEKMLAGSEFSLTGHDTDLEIDYYDYNVHNTSAVPGSYLGMDPAYCVWIPPISSPEQWSNDRECVEMKEMSIEYLPQPAEEMKKTEEKFREECDKSFKGEKGKRISDGSNASTVVAAAQGTPEEELKIQTPISPDTPVKVETAFVVKESGTLKRETKAISTSYDGSEEAENLKFADDDEETADSLNGAGRSGKVSVTRTLSKQGKLQCFGN